MFLLPALLPRQAEPRGTYGLVLGLVFSALPGGAKSLPLAPQPLQLALDPLLEGRNPSVVALGSAAVGSLLPPPPGASWPTVGSKATLGLPRGGA